MLGLGPIAFAVPWILGALIVLPILWWLLRLTPPSPRIVQFPAIRLLRDLVAREETPARTPLWLLIMRTVLAALVILALAQPLLNPRAGLPGSGPIVMVVDNGWGAGRDWPARQRTMADLIDQAERNNRDLIVLATSPDAAGEKPRPSNLMRPADARRVTQSLAPMPWPTDRAAVVEALRGLQVQGSAHTVWLSDGLSDAAAQPLAARLQQMGGVEVLMDGADRLPNLLLPPATEGTDLVATVKRADTTLPTPVTVRAVAADGRLLARQTAAFAPGADSAEIRLALPVELRNEVIRMSIEGEQTAGATVLLDERWRRRPVGLVSGRPEGENQPLLSDLYYLERALSPFSEIRRGSVLDLMSRDLSVLILADIGALTDMEASAVESWVERGGVLVRFAGPRLAQHTDHLVPVRLRLGDRTLGGALSWSEPAKLAPFPPSSPFAGMHIPPDVVVDRQVLAEPSIDLPDKTWARLADGTPLVTAENREEGKIVLVHTTANPDWSNLALSGLFVDMLRRITALSEGVSGDMQATTFAPIEVLDGRGQLVPPPATVFPIPGNAFRPDTLGPRHPPGFYGTEEARRALNLTSLVTKVEPLHFKFDADIGLYEGEFLWHHSCEADEHIAAYGIGQDSACWTEIGYATGYVSGLFGRLVIFREVECRAMGHKVCRVIGKTAEQWGDVSADLALLYANATPAPTASFNASCVVSICAATSRLLTSLATLPAPLGPTCRILAASASTTVRASARSASSPPIIMVSLPDAAPAGPPLTGASRKPCPASARRRARARLTSGSDVDVSIRITRPSACVPTTVACASSIAATSWAVGREKTIRSLVTNSSPGSETKPNPASAAALALPRPDRSPSPRSRPWPAWPPFRTPSPRGRPRRRAFSCPWIIPLMQQFQDAG
mgnify:CR=1 FL=1